jgi:hypothetical protein
MVEDRRRPYPLACPVCRHAMIGEKVSPENKDFDRHRCLSCGLVIEFSSRASPHKESGDV